MAVMAASGAPTAMAQQPPVPAGCSASELDLGILAQPNIARQGDLINFYLPLDNVGELACNVKNVNVTLDLPSRRGTLAGAPTSVFIDPEIEAQRPRRILGPFPYTVNVDPDVSLLVAQTQIRGAELQDRARRPVNIDKGVGVIVFTPSITIDKVGSMTGPAPAPQTVTYTFYVRNGSDQRIEPELTALSNVSVTDDKCGNPAYVSGDTNGNSKLEISETWAFQCTLTHPAPGTYTNVAVANGQNVLYNRPVPVVSPPDNWTVVLTPPAPPAPPAPPVPQSTVKPVNAAQAPCDIASPTGLNVRAGETTTIRVKVRNVDAGTEARITLPGGKVLKAKVNSAGTATFKVRPTKSGRAAIRVAACGDVARFTVKPARQVQTRRVPRVTG